MWKKDEASSPGSTPTSPGSPVPPDRPPRAPSSSGSRPQATIGRSITIRGDVTGDEDLVIEGRIDGAVDLEQHNVTVGSEGRVKADITGRTVTIEGEVEGNVRGQEQVALRAPSKVTGDIVAPRVVLEDGATFRGSIDMSGQATERNRPEPVKAATPGTSAEKTGSKPAAVASGGSKS